MKITPAQLSPFADPDELLKALYSLEGPAAELRDALLILLGHADPDIRAEVIRIVVRRWKDKEARGLAFHLLRNDENVEVREAAAYAIAATASDGTRIHDVSALLTVLRDDEEAVSVRRAAYEGLLIIHRKPTFPTMRRTFDPVRDVDWEWISSLALGG